MRYPPQFLDRLRQHFRLSEVIGQRITLKRAGREYSALCPFHNEKSSSFTVNDEKAFFHCFGCGAHGDVIGFIKDYENLTYTQAVESLAQQAGISLPQPTRVQREHYDASERQYKLMEAASNWFTLQLRHLGGERARDYLNKRGLTDETVREFRLGFGPQKRHALKDALMQQGFREAELLQGGLIVQAETGGDSYDKFRGRLMFPIHDSSGRVIAFGGRLIDPEAKGPKYLNSPDTPLFKKSYNLYHLDVARRAAGKANMLLVVEGYMDVIALAQAGMDEAVAPLGTAITREQLGMLWQIADEPVLCLDGDAAGWRAMEKALELALPLLSPGKSLSFARLPMGEDPDSLVRKNGKDALKKLLAQRMPLIDVFWEKYYSQQSLATPEQQAGAEQALTKAVALIQDASVRGLYQQAIKERLWNARKTHMKGAAGKNKSKFEKLAVDAANSLRAIGRSRRALLNVKQQMQQGLEDVHLSMMLLFMYYPALWDGAWDETLAQAAYGRPELEKISQALLQVLGQDELPDRAFLQREISAIVGEKEWAAFLRMTSHYLPKSLLLADENSGLKVAESHLHHLGQRLELLALEQDYREAERQFASHLEEREWKRMEHLRQRIEEVKGTQNFFPDEKAT